MSVLELSELVKVLEEKFGVSSAAPMVMAGGGAAPATEGEEDEGGLLNVELTVGGDNKIAVIKALREVLPELGLKDAKDVVEAAPKMVKEGVEKAEAEEIKKKLEEAGAKVTLK
ncbi:MAG: 50S ribosomal protein L7/L12 [Candidatus Spechtbacteria bacterium RIFCSPLOWO2_01_FULL_43_12]|uniref:Large ribosomal subunit protein bL12 n=1 Tax=Candidatus Spechtbacteria bacterium RIFCSPLOWO2_01_FULL_43_12 TaxID=1802162 RepID=A0A1G2HFZ2_9BACT|nr:MAG: 50S ribosomal protein L7/L12 [Candidatus Spechtbacteria bacterium RIFCSPLOWO2_01_FULL_43_12]